MSEQPLFAQQTSTDSASGGANLDTERLKYITSTFAAAPYGGLGVAAYGAGFAACQMIDAYWRGSHWTGLGILLWAAACVVWFVYGRRYYASRFGWVKPQAKKPLDLSGAQIAIGLLVLCAIWLTADVLRNLFHVPIDFLTLVQSTGVLLAIIYISFSPRGRFMPVRLAIWAAVALAQAVVAVLPLVVWLDPRQMLLWKTLNAGSRGIFIMVMGLCDHIAMVRMLPKRVEGVDRD